MRTSGKLLSPGGAVREPPVQAKVLASVMCNLMGICRAGKCLWVPKCSKLYLRFLSSKRTSLEILQ